MACFPPDTKPYGLERRRDNIYIYGFSLIPKGLDHLFFDNLWAIGHYIVRKGEFDKYLTRPINTLFHVMVEKLQIDAFGELITGIALVSVTLPQLNIEWDPLKVILGILVIPFAALIYTGIKTITASVAFWAKRSGNIIYMFYMVNDFAKYPITIYNRVVRDVITYFIPFATDLILVSSACCIIKSSKLPIAK